MAKFQPKIADEGRDEGLRDHHGRGREPDLDPQHGQVPAHHACAAERDEQRQARQPDEARVARDGRTHHFSFPNRPAGRIISTMAMMTKTTVFDASG